jgi:hypothetical protein
LSDSLQTRFTIVSIGMDPAAVESYLLYYGQIDPILPAAERKPGCRAVRRIGAFRDDALERQFAGAEQSPPLSPGNRPSRPYRVGTSQ